jgi:hypothetical protein
MPGRIEFTDFASPRGPLDADTVPLSQSVAGLRSVYVVRCHLDPVRGESITVPLVFFPRDHVLMAAFDHLRRGVGLGSDGASVIDEDAARLWGRLLWSKLHPDIGVGISAGHHAQLGKRRVFFQSFFGWLKLMAAAPPLKPRSDLWNLLSEEGERVESPSFLEFKKRLHFGGNFDVLPTEQDLRAADSFLDAVGVEVAKAERRHQENPRWAAKRRDGRLPEAFYKWVRRSVEPLLRRHQISNGVRRAATLLSYRDAVELGDHLARRVHQALPTGLLSERGRKVFDAMWLVESTKLDNHGRFDIPVMASPALASALEYVLEFDDAGRARDKQEIVAGLIESVATGQRNRAVNIALGFSSYFPAWLADERAGERGKTRHRRDVEGAHGDEARHLDDRDLPAKAKKPPASVSSERAVDTGDAKPKPLWIDGQRRGEPRFVRRRKGKIGTDS